MQPFFNDNTNTLVALKEKDNILVFSSLKAFHNPAKSKGFAVRCVLEGMESYTFNGQKYDIHAGQYLLSNTASKGYIEVASNEIVKGICISIVPEFLSEVVASICRPDTAFSDAELGQFFSSALFLENQYDVKKTQVGQFLTNLALSAQKNELNKDELGSAFFYTLSERIIEDQIPIFKQLQSIPSIKSDTKKELYKRLTKGREFIDTWFLTPLTIESVAKEACMSEYHFFRLFKSVFGLSPHQYILKKRLEYGQNVLLQDKYAVSTAAFESGFSDIFTFSKAFKKHFGYAPSTLLK
jgi:AraC family transcriptional regulator